MSRFLESVHDIIIAKVSVGVVDGIIIFKVSVKCTWYYDCQ